MNLFERPILMYARSWLMLLIAVFPVIAVGQEAPSEPEGLDIIRRDANAMKPLVSTPPVGKFLDAVKHLPDPSVRTLYRDADGKYHAESAVESMPKEQREKLTKRPVDAQLYYQTKYGTPIAYARLLEVLGKKGIKDVKGLRILDYGYGGIGHLRLLANCGADCVGVDVDPFLPALYCKPDDQGVIKRDGREVGKIKLVDGRWPAEEKVKTEVGDKFDLIISKNTLKNGYLHPARPVDKRMLVDLGVSDDEFVRVLHDSLNPGGIVMIYNLCPAEAPPDKPYIPWADGRCPFHRRALKKAGFKILAYNVDDSKAAREMGHALGWDAGPGGMKLETDLFAHYTVLQRKSAT